MSLALISGPIVLMRLVILSLIFLSVSFAKAERFVPRRMSESERTIALQILGFGSASKLLTNPFPLGGHSGFEMGVSSEYLQVQDLSSLGDKSTRNRELNYNSFSVAKGLFYNVDASAHFTPAFQKEDLSSYGAQLRWGFYQFPFLPGGLSLVVDRSETNYGNLLSTQTTGQDLIATVVVEDVALYFGIGQAKSKGTFSGGTLNGTVTESATDACFSATYCDSVRQELNQTHTVFGVNVSFNEFFGAVEINRYFISSYSAKIGWRF